MSLVVVGAGPKALAVLTRAAVLREMGYRVPEIIVVEEREVAANWTPAGGRTTGRLRLGSYPEKDVGYPYESTEFGADDAECDRLLHRYSWVAYLVAERRYGAWMDRGRPQPQHREWAAYLRWVAAQLDYRRVRGRAVELETVDGGWSVRVEGEVPEVRGDAVMLTGQGPVGGRFPAATDSGTFFRAGPDPAWRGREVAVIGGGETSASVVEELVAAGVESVTVITPDPVIFSRAEGFVENRLFNDPDLWSTLTAADRRALITRIDRGVYSTDALARLSAEPGVGHRSGRVVGCGRTADGVAVELLDGHGLRETIEFAAVVDGSAGDRGWFLAALGPRAGAALVDRIGVPVEGPGAFAALEPLIDRNLSVDGLAPRLVLPMLAGFAQGPGFPNLSCLGRLSERVLRPLVAEPRLAAVHVASAGRP